MHDNQHGTIIDELTNQLGSDQNNIKVIKNWMPEKDINTFLDYVLLYNGKRDQLQDIRFRNAFYQRELARTYEHLMRAEAMRLYQRDFKSDRTIDFNSREEEVGLHTDFIQPQFYDPLDPENLKNPNYGWSGHLSIIVYLNDDFEGGEICFPQHNLEIKPEKGMFISFPGNTNYRHLIKPFNGNKRCTISLWTQFKDFK
jgi:2OG-Fe(II) oxygenase superfamily